MHTEEIRATLDAPFEGYTDPTRPPEVFRDPAFFYRKTLAVWSHGDVTTALLRTPPTHLSNYVTEGVPNFILNAVMHGPPNREGAEHDRLRKAVEYIIDESITYETYAEVRSRVHSLMEAAGPEFDMAHDLADPLTWSTVCSVFDDPELLEDRDHFFKELDQFGKLSALNLPWNRGNKRIKEYIKRRRARATAEADKKPIDDILTSADLTEKEKEAVLATVLFAGPSTTSRQLNAAMELMTDLPDDTYDEFRRDSLADNGELLSRWYNEAGRLRPPALVRPMRAKLPFRIAEQDVEPGWHVQVGWASANRDRKLVPAFPDKFDPRRQPVPHFGFSKGRHACPGRDMSKMMALPCLRALMEREPLRIKEVVLGGGALILRTKKMVLAPR